MSTEPEAPAIPADNREPYGRLFHTQGRLTVNAELPERQRRGIGPWEERDPMQQEIDMRGANAVAVQAVHDAGIEVDRMRAQLSAIAAVLPAARRALTIAIAEAQYEAEAKPFRAALRVLSGDEEASGG